MSLVMHFSWSGHVFLSLQVHGSMTSHCGLLHGSMTSHCGLPHTVAWSMTSHCGLLLLIDPCTCRDKKTCPLQEKCMTKDIVYKATITTSNTTSTKHYIGMTASTFKERYRNHIKSFNHKRYSNDTELSKYIWKLKDNKQDFDITWSVLKQSISYTGGSKRCNLCLEEKLCILKDKNKQNLLNKKSEIVSTCNHRKKHLINNLRNGRNACIV